jgi:hypothetical protein
VATILIDNGTLTDYKVRTRVVNTDENIQEVVLVDAAGAAVVGRGMLADWVHDPTGTARPFQYVSVNATADGDNAIISAPGSGFKIRVLGGVLTCTGVGTIIIQDTTAGPNIHGRFRSGVDGAGVAIPSGVPAFQLAENVGLEINNPSGVDTLGWLTYVVLPI